jgi:hypothetical protein
MSEIKETKKGQFYQITPSRIHKLSVLQDELNRDLPEHHKPTSKNDLMAEAMDLLFKKYKIK